LKQAQSLLAKDSLFETCFTIQDRSIRLSLDFDKALDRPHPRPNLDSRPAFPESTPRGRDEYPGKALGEAETKQPQATAHSTSFRSSYRGKS